MARTWSNAKKPVDDRSAAQRARSRPSGLTAFTILLILAVILFLGLIGETVYQAVRHPVTEQSQPTVQPPKDD